MSARGARLPGLHGAWSHEPHSNLGVHVFHVFGQHQSGGGTARPPRLGALLVGHHRERHRARRRGAGGRSRPARAACDSSTSPRSASGSRDSRAQRLVSIALPRVLSERSRSTQQAHHPGIFGIEAQDFARRGAAIRRPMMSSRWPRPAASSSIASATREAPPVSATMPSALRLSATSSPGTRPMNQRKPSRSSRTTAAPAATVDQPRRRNSRWPRARGAAAPGSPPAPSSVLDPTIGISRPTRRKSTRRNYSLKFGGVVAAKLTNGFDRAVDGAARGCGGHRGDQHDLASTAI